jgi:hypothetical protein
MAARRFVAEVRDTVSRRIQSAAVAKRHDIKQLSSSCVESNIYFVGTRDRSIEEQRFERGHLMYEALIGFSALAIACFGAIVGAAITRLPIAVALRWCKNNGLALFMLGVGVVLGAVLAAVTWNDDKHISDGLASLIGAFAGMTAAIGGGFWLWQEQDARAIERTHLAMDTNFVYFVFTIPKIEKVLKPRVSLNLTASKKPQT